LPALNLLGIVRDVSRDLAWHDQSPPIRTPAGCSIVSGLVPCDASNQARVLVA
jgi:hypothetical protein